MKMTIVKECSDFLKESQGSPLIKFLPKNGSDIRKIKVRKNKSETPFDKAFNTVFSDHANLRKRCVFTNGASYFKNSEPSGDMSPFYIFPIDGFKFMYSPNVIDSSAQYQESFNWFNHILSKCKATETFSDVLKYDYKSNDLLEGIKLGCEIILYGFPYYYAIRKQSIKSYSTLFSL